MATVNVYTYYTHKLAYEKSKPLRPAARRQTRRPNCPALVKLGLSCGLATTLGLTLACTPAQPALVILAGSAWGGMLGWMGEKVRERTSKVVSVLQGRPLSPQERAALVRQAR